MRPLRLRLWATMRAELGADWWAPLRPPPLRTVSQWADTERVLTSESSAAPGPWRTSVTPYLREIMDRLSASDPCERVIAMVASQMGKTEAILNAIGYTAQDCPSPILMVQPRDADVKDYSRRRVAPMIRASPALRQRFADARSRDGGASMALREYVGGSVAMVSAQSPAGLAAKAIRVLLLDEVDRYPASAGAEGDPVELAIQRTVTFPRRKILMTSTPTVRGRSRVETEMQQTGWRVYHIPCPHCGHAHPWEWEDLRWERGRPETAAVYCRGCDAAIAEDAKRVLLARGQWVPTRPEREDGRAYGYQIEALSCPYGLGPSWSSLARRWEASECDTEMRRVFVNVALARTWDETQLSTVDADGLHSRAEAYAAPCPAGVLTLTAGVDVQVDRLEVSVWGWGVGEESWLIEHRMLLGDPTTPAPWAALDAMLRERWTHQRGAELGIDASCVDSGAWAQQVQAWCAERRGMRVWATKGGSDAARAVWPPRYSRGGGGKAVWVIGVSAAKETLWRQAQIASPGAGYIHTSDPGPDAEWYAQLVAERPRAHAGKTTWVRSKGARAEALDCRVYAYAALCSLGSTRRTFEQAAKRLARATSAVDAAARSATTEPASALAPTPAPVNAPALPAPSAPLRPAKPRRPVAGSWLDPGARLR